MMERVLDLVRLERVRQEALYPEVNNTLLDGTGPDVQWLWPLTEDPATAIETELRWEYNRHSLPTWMHLVREEMAEAFQETDPIKLAEELVQVAALCCSWVERLFAREVQK